MRNTGFKKKLYAFRPDAVFVDTQRSHQKQRREPCDAPALERGVRQRLADKVSGTLAGLWLLVPEHLRLGTWDLLVGWSGRPAPSIEPRLALQLVHEAALCRTGIRQGRSLSQRGFELLNGLPFLATDQAIHDLLDAHCVRQAQTLQVALGKLRRASGHFQGALLAIDPHALRSYTKRHTVRRKFSANDPITKNVLTFFCLDADTHQPIAFVCGNAARTVAQATPELLTLVQAIVESKPQETLILADTEHFCAALFEHVAADTPFDLLTPMRDTAAFRKQVQRMPANAFTPTWAGFATAVVPYHPRNAPQLDLYQLIQRCGEKNGQYQYKGFASTRATDRVKALTQDYPKRWHIEEFYNLDQALGWDRAGTLNLNIRYGHMTMALIAQAVIHQFRQRIGEPFNTWEVSHLAHNLFEALDGDVRVVDDTILITYYNAPNADLLRPHYEHLPQKLEAEHICPTIPWLYNFKLDFRFK